jgi:hypothetical protein
LAFAATLTSGVFISQPAQAFTLNAAQCARLTLLINYLTTLSDKYPGNNLITFLLKQATEAFTNYGCS